VPPRYIVIHHTDIAKQEHAEQLSIVNESHKRRGYSLNEYGYNVAYHYFIGTDGELIHTRPDDDRSAHTGCGLGEDRCKEGMSEINEQSIGIVIAGDFEHEQINRRQLQTLKRIVTEKQQEYGIPKENVIPHREASPTKCAGANLIKLLWP
jgi:N-acetyl-anhydromuramyl-L-alanine amidase AmpD